MLYTMILYVFYNALLYDIEHASQYIYLEFYRFSYHHLGEKFRDALVKKCKEGVEVKILLDSWGTSPNPGFFETLTQAGGMVRFFEKFRFSVRLSHPKSSSKSPEDSCD